MRNLILFVATGAGTGYSPLASGTVGSALAVALWAGVRGWPPAAYLALVIAVTALGVWASGRAEAIFGGKDDGRITIDEVAGMLLSLALLPATASPILVAGAGFLLFRAFDVAKPPPALLAETLPGGLGVMADDLVAGLYANLCGQLLFRWIWPGAAA
jgi:phosphatidylglycerophosphatase A